MEKLDNFLRYKLVTFIAKESDTTARLRAIIVEYFVTTELKKWQGFPGEL